jgi:hypothetical protein
MKPSRTFIEALPIITSTVVDYIHAVSAQSNDTLPVLLATLLVPVKHDWQMIPSTFHHSNLETAFAWTGESDISGRHGEQIQVEVDRVAGHQDQRRPCSLHRRGDAGADSATFGASLPRAALLRSSKV